MKLYSKTLTFSTQFGLVMLIAVGNVESGSTSTSLDDLRTGWSGGGSGSSPKPGECPPTDPQMHCFEQKNLCNSDCECPQKQKCCFQQDCGYSCSEPTIIIDEIGTCDEKPIVATKPGICPKPLDNIRCFQCYDQCKSDCECSGKEICCPQPGCGNWCRNSTITTTF